MVVSQAEMLREAKDAVAVLELSLDRPGHADSGAAETALRAALRRGGSKFHRDAASPEEEEAARRDDALRLLVAQVGHATSLPRHATSLTPRGSP